MFCKNCGTENANGAKFCKACGTPLTDGGEQKEKKEKVTSSVSTPKVDVAQLVEKVKALPKNVMIGAGAAFIALVVIICVVVNTGKTIALDDYLIIEAEGYDGYGTASVRLDWSAIEEKYGSKVSFSAAAKREYGGLANMMSPIDIVQDCVSVKLAESSDLSNGDVIAYTWNVDEDLSDYVNCKVKFKDGDFTVSGLEEIGTFDAFADLTIEFSGVAPNGSAALTYSGSEMNEYDFECDKTSGLSNGETVKVIIDDTAVEYYARNLGKVPAELEKDYKVEGLQSYLNKIEDIDNTVLSSLQKQASDVYNAKVAQDWGEGEALETFTYIGNYLLTSKDEDPRGANNYLFLVYKAQVRNTYSRDDESYNELNDIYWYIRYDDLMVNADGTVNVELTDYDTPNERFEVDSGISSGWWSTKYWTYYGYETLEALYKDVVTANLDAYNHADNVDESLAPVTVPETEAEEEMPITEGGYILENSDTELLEREDLEGLSKEECRIARNEIYARHGRKFDDEELQAYFNSCDWYEGTIEPKNFKETELSEIEVANKDLITAYEAEKGY